MWSHSHFPIYKVLLPFQYTGANIPAGYWKYYCLSKTFSNLFSFADWFGDELYNVSVSLWHDAGKSDLWISKWNVNWCITKSRDNASRCFEWNYLSCCAAPKLLQLSSARFYKLCFVNGKAADLQAWVGPEGSSMLRFSDLMTVSQHMKVVRFVSPMHWPSLPPNRKYSWYSFLSEVESTPGQ